VSAKSLAAQVGAVALAGLAVPAGADSLRQTSWTLHDLDKVAEAYIRASAGMPNKKSQASVLIDLVDPLIAAGDTQKAREVALKAASLLDPPLDPPNEFKKPFLRAAVIEKLAQLNDVQDAEKLASVETAAVDHAFLLGKLGKGRAHAGDVNDALKAAKAIRFLSDGDNAPTAKLAAASANAIGEISIALGDIGASDKALLLAKGLPTRVHVIAETALVLCKADSARTYNPQRGREIAEQAETMAVAAVKAADTPAEKINLIVASGEGLAECMGAASVRTFTEVNLSPELRDRALRGISDQLARRGEITVARALLPTPDPADTEDLLGTAERLVKLGDRETARKMALHASVLPGPVSKAGSAADMPRLIRIFDILTELGAYDEAIAAVQPMDIQNRQQFYLGAVEAEIQKANIAAISKTLPIAIEIFKSQLSTDRQASNSLFELTKNLALAGYQDEALKILGALEESADSPYPILPWQAAELKADMGDLEGALAAADAAGPMTAKPSADQVAMLALLYAYAAKTPPTSPVPPDAIHQAETTLGTVSGPRANALGAIASDMAAKGDIQAAFRAEAGLDADQSSVIAAVRDNAVASIERAQEKSGDLRGAFTTALRIRQPFVRTLTLLSLAKAPLHPQPISSPPQHED
jgi:tetratricopeptide (TPR) repeat protein